MDEEVKMTRKKWLLATATISAAAIVVLLYEPAIKIYHRQKEKRSLSLAQQFFNKGDYPNATLSVRQVLLLNPKSIPACSIMADIADRRQLPTTLDWHRRLAELAPTPENKLQLAEAGLRYQSRPFLLTEQILRELSATATNLAYYHVIAAELAINLRQLDAAAASLASAVKLAPTNLLYQINLAMVQLSSRDSATQAAARSRLNAFTLDTNFAPNAYRALITDRLANNDGQAAQSLSEKLMRFTPTALTDQLQHLAILKKNQSPDFAAQLKYLQQAAATNAPRAAQTAIWMQANGFAADALQWLGSLPKPIRSQPPVQLAQATAMDTKRDWLELRQLCTRGNWEDLDFLRLAFLSRAWLQLGETPVAQSHWHSAVGAAGNRLGALSSLLELTARWQMADERLDLFWLLFQKFPRDPGIATALKQHYQATGNTTGLRRVFMQLTTTYPDSFEIKNDLAYINLLLHTNLAEAGTIAAKLQAQRPEDPAIASTHAFALHLKGRDAEGLAVMQKLPAAALEQPAIALHYGILLAATGDKVAARRYLNLAQRETGMLPEEKKLGQQSADMH
ncbi:MAG: hypothetical protein WCH99_05525 [Verrucomicrobiota bacterium]